MKDSLKKLIFPITGLITLIWVLIRVIPKPSRAAYPCIRASAPVASTFILYILGFFSSIAILQKAKKFAVERRFILFTIAFITGISLGLFTLTKTNSKVYAKIQAYHEAPNSPMGIGQGIFPGRVAWVHNPDATRAECTNTNNDYWFEDDNTNQAVVSNMLSEGLQLMTGTASDTDAWNAIFSYYNQTHGKGDVGYTSGEKIVIKINMNGENNWPREPNINTSPQICYAILDQLINVAGVAQSDISIGDPNCPMNNQTYVKLNNSFPDVTYWGNGPGRASTTPTSSPVLFGSDGGYGDPLPQSYIDASYMINIPVFKKHHRAGISLVAKNHFGSIAPYTGGAWHLHYGLPVPNANEDATGPNGDFGVYRCLVDILGHEQLGGKTILYLVDAIWGSTNWGHPPIKWQMEPFNNDWPSSLFLSQDPVAIESVGFDFLYEEFDEDHPTEGGIPTSSKGPFPHFAGVDDYLQQAADSLNWPADILYDPEKDGTVLPRSLGVHEHWDNATSKKYSRNLGADTGIELVTNTVTNIDDKKSELHLSSFQLNQNYPNPFNGTTNIWYNLGNPGRVQLTVYNALGQKINTIVDDFQAKGAHLAKWNGLNNLGNLVPSGLYIYELKVTGNSFQVKEVKKMVYTK